ncbi:MAG TPA: alanine racemase [Nocardioidaceae bacterium]|nr:alanine racemase [Nocardioidaceae bacterium]
MKPPSPPRGRPAPRAEIVVDLAAIRRNVTVLRDKVEGRQLMAVVKADGYGHGMVHAARAARAGGADWVGVAVLEEALELRRSGDTGRILAWLSVPGEDYREAVGAGLDLTAYTVAELDEICAAARSIGSPARVQLKVDTGLSRGGSSTGRTWSTLVAAAVAAEEEGVVRVTGIWSHFACSDEPDHPANDMQERAFRDALSVAERAGLSPEIRHLCNSAGALTRPSSWFDLVRCGIAAYGLSPIPGLATSAEIGLVPAMTVRARLALVKRIPSGSGVSYGHTYRTRKDTNIAVVPVGYGDGIPRHASSKAPVYAAGRARLIAGRVCMDQFVLDIDDDEAAAGETVVLFGTGEHGEPTAQDWATACQTISYEIVTRVGGRMTRRYVDSALDHEGRA